MLVVLAPLAFFIEHARLDHVVGDPQRLDLPMQPVAQRPGLVATVDGLGLAQLSFHELQ